MLVGNEIFGNAKNGINLYQNSDYLYLFGNDVRVRADTTGNALDIRDGAHVVSGGNRYQGGLEAAVEVNVTAGDGPRFVDDVLDRKSVVSGKRVAGSVGLGGCRILKKKKKT